MPDLATVHVQNSAASPFEHYPVRCDSLGFGQGLLESDCVTAMTKLPTDQPGDVHMDPQKREMIYPEFSDDSLVDRHRLPVSEEVGTCAVKVRLTAPFRDDHSSWRIIRLRLMDIFRNCVVLGDAGVGGITITGQRKRVELMLYSASEPDLSLIMLNKTMAVPKKDEEALLRA